jgi:LPS O-antigen subunit length determinant protein (WzzB/FepE family)
MSSARAKKKILTNPISSGSSGLNQSILSLSFDANTSKDNRKRGVSYNPDEGIHNEKEFKTRGEDATESQMQKLKSYINDLEKNLEINKEILNNVLASNPSDSN